MMESSSAPRPFDRALHRRRLDRAIADFGRHAFLFDEVAQRLLDRLADVTRRFPRVLTIGDRNGALADNLRKRAGTEVVLSLDPSPNFASTSRGPAVAAEEDALPFADHSLDLVIANLTFHWVNDLPGALVQLRRAIKPDGLLLAAMAGGGTLSELRLCLMDAELSLLGGVETRVLPFAQVQDAGNLLARAGFALPVADADNLTVTYADPLALLRDLHGMGETAALTGPHRPLRRDVLTRAMDLYISRFAEPDGRIPARFEILHMAGWAPDPSQPQPLKPGEATHRLADALAADAPGGM